ncbi:MAG: glycosyl hydrolase-related protein [Verrucomicrobiota bacterium]
MNGHFIPNTHLDREWTLDFQHTRKMTVDFINDLLDIMDEIPEYHFLLDSQAVPIEDYLEIMPENRDRLAKMIAAGRINAGPWYTALDMNLISGESIVRNMLYGHLVVEEFGPVMKVGYTPFGWGQSSQLPQIYRGFGIEVAFFYRGVTSDQLPQAEFIWRGADGSTLLTSRFGTGSRYNFYFDVWRKAFYTGMPERLNRRFHWKEDATPFKLTDEGNRYDHGYVFPENRPIQSEAVAECFKDLLAREKEQFGSGEIAFMHGMDTTTPDLREDEVIRSCQQHLGEDDTLFYSSMPRYANAILEASKGKELIEINGEARHVKFNEFGFSYIGNDMLSARSRQKAFMTEVENRLIRVVEPLACQAELLQLPYPIKYLDVAWKQYLKCHPHDTIGGCGIDQIEQDTMYRLRDVMSAANVVCSESLMAIQGEIDTEELGHEGVVLTVYNPSPYVRSELVVANVDVPQELEMKTGFALLDDQEAVVDFAVEPTGYFGKVFRDHADLALMSYADEFKVRFEATDVPALGYKSYILKQGEVLPLEARENSFVLENDQIRATINENGTVDLQELASGHVYSGLNYFLDEGEVGHSWSRVAPMDDLVIDSRKLKADRKWVRKTPVESCIEVELVMDIPRTTPRSEERFDWRQTKREATDLIPMHLIIRYSLEKSDGSLRVEVEFNNQCQNHRLRAHFPTGLAADESYAEAPFDVITRRFRRDEENPYAHFPDLTFPMGRFAGIQSDEGNFTLLSGGLKEYEVLDDQDATLAVTLLRAYENNFCTAGDWDLEARHGDLSQGIGKHLYQYKIYPGSTGEHHEHVFRQADRFSAPMMAAETRARSGSLPSTLGLLEIDNPCWIVSGMKRASRSQDLMVRVFNCADNPQAGTFKFHRAPVAARRTDLNEQPIDKQVELQGHCVRMELQPKEIATLLVSMPAEKQA